MFKKFITVTLLSLCCCSAALSYSSGQKTLAVGTSSTYPPYEFLNTQGHLDGFDYDLMEAVGAKLGKKIVWTDTGEFAMLIPAVLTDKVEVIIGAISATRARAERVLFSDIYEKSDGSFIVNAKATIKGLEDLKGKVAVIQLGTVQETFLRSIMGKYGFQLKTFQKFEECAREITIGRADFCFMETAVAKKFLTLKDFKGKLKIAFDHEIEGSGIAMAMKKGQTKLKADIDKALKELEAEGTMKKLFVKWGLDKRNKK